MEIKEVQIKTQWDSTTHTPEQLNFLKRTVWSVDMYVEHWEIPRWHISIMALPTKAERTHTVTQQVHSQKFKVQQKWILKDTYKKKMSITPLFTGSTTL